MITCVWIIDITAAIMSYDCVNWFQRRQMHWKYIKYKKLTTTPGIANTCILQILRAILGLLNHLVLIFCIKSLFCVYSIPCLDLNPYFQVQVRSCADRIDLHLYLCNIKRLFYQMKVNNYIRQNSVKFHSYNLSILSFISVLYRSGF